VRDHTKLRAFALADQLALAVYQCTAIFPRHEQFGLAQQLRRAAVSCASNIVEGCSRSTQSEYARFLEIAYGSAREVGYQLSLAFRLKYLDEQTHQHTHQLCVETSKVLSGLIRAMQRSL
jgi:four helix bundle protein